MLRKAFLIFFLSVLMFTYNLSSLEVSNGDYTFILNAPSREAMLNFMFPTKDKSKKKIFMPILVEANGDKYVIRNISEKAVKSMINYCSGFFIVPDILNDTDANRSALNWFFIYNIPVFKKVSSSAELFKK